MISISLIIVCITLIETITGKPIDLMNTLTASSDPSITCNVSRVGFDSSKNPPSIELDQLKLLHARIKDRAHFVRNHAKDVKEHFVKYLKDSEFEHGLKANKKEWEPNHHQMLKETSSSSNDKEVIQKTHKYMEHYTFRWEEIVKQRSKQGANLAKEFEDILTLSKGLLCELTLVLSYMRIDSWRDKNSLELPPLPESPHSRRLVREYVVLKDYIQAMELLGQLFSKIKLN